MIYYNNNDDDDVPFLCFYQIFMRVVQISNAMLTSQQMK